MFFEFTILLKTISPIRGHSSSEPFASWNHGLFDLSIPSVDKWKDWEVKSGIRDGTIAASPVWRFLNLVQTAVVGGIHPQHAALIFDWPVAITVRVWMPTSPLPVDGTRGERPSSSCYGPLLSPDVIQSQVGSHQVIGRLQEGGGRTQAAPVLLPWSEGLSLKKYILIYKY